MPSVVITGKEDGKSNFVPRRSRFKVYSIPDEYVVTSGTSTSKSITLDLDPGKYRIKVWKHGVANWGQEFLVGMDADEFKVLASRRPKFVKVSFTTEGVRWACKLCPEQNMTHHGAVKHEWMEHFGIDPLKVSEEDIDDILSSSAPSGPGARNADDVDVIAPLQRRPGRPRKDSLPPGV